MMAVERMKSCTNILELSKELGVHRTVLYLWRKEFTEQGAGPARAEETPLEQQNRQLKQALGEKTLEVDFFAGALQKVGARRQGNSTAGGRASTSKSGSGCRCKAK
jgi:transposase-like protein